MTSHEQQQRLAEELLVALTSFVAGKTTVEQYRNQLKYIEEKFKELDND